MEKVIVAFWPRGYAHEEGTSKVTLNKATEQEYLEEIKKIDFPKNAWATISGIYPVNPPAQTETFSDEYIREMSTGG